jgi:CRP-like cAMP-binding protein
MAADKGKSKSKKKGLGSTATLTELIAAKNYPEAIEVLRGQLAHRPGIQTRLQLADLLLLSGRRDEAMPIFMGLADELTADGFVAKALAILKRVDRLEPGRADVEERLGKLAKQPQRSSNPVVAPPAPPQKAPALSFGMEEMGAEPAPAATAPEPEPEKETPAPPAEVPPVAAGAPASEPAAPLVEEAPPVEAAETAAPTPAAAPAPEKKKEGSGIGGIWKRLMTALAPTVDLPPGAANPEPAATAAAPTPTPTTGTETLPPVGGPAPEAGPASEPEPKAEPTSEPAEAAEEEIVVSTEDVAATTTAAAAEEQPVSVEPIVEPEPAPEPAAAAAEESPSTTTPVEPVVTETPAIVTKLGGVFKRFLANLPGGEPDAPEATEKDLEAALTAAGIDPETAKEDEEAFFDVFIDEDDTAAPAEEPIALPAPSDTPTGGITPPKWSTPMSESGFRDQVLDLIEEVLKRPPEVTPAAPGESTEPIANAYRDELVAHPLFRDLSENEMLAMLRALRLACYDPGEIIVTEGEPGAGLFLLISGVVKIFARNPSGHNLPVSVLTEGSFFGEMSLLSGKPRNATCIAAESVELLELPKPLLDAIALSHPRVRDIVDALYLQRASSPEMAAVRNVAIGDAQTRERAMQVLKAYFGGRRWEPRMQLKLAMVLLKAGKEDEAVPVLVDLAETLLRERDPAKAIAILKKVEAIRKRGQEVVNLAPLPRDGDTPLSDLVRPTAPRKPVWMGHTEAFFSDWLGTFRRSVAAETAGAAPKPIPGYGPELVASPLFEGFTEEELLAFIQALRVSAYEPGEIIITEGEPGQSVFILTVGSVRVFVRNPTGHDMQLCQLKEGAFFGEMSALSGRPRTATVTAASRCELLELDRATLDAIAQTHPRIRQVLEEVYIERAGSAAAERIRTASSPPA